METETIPSDASLLTHEGMVIISARKEKFIVADYFREDISAGAAVKIRFICQDFKELFLNKVESPQLETALRYFRLNQICWNLPIVNELGGEDKVETSLASVFALMERQRNGEQGILDVQHPNVFYVRDTRCNELHDLGVWWNDTGWCLSAGPLNDGYSGWTDTPLVFSP